MFDVNALITSLLDKCIENHAEKDCQWSGIKVIIIAKIDFFYY